MVHFSFIFHSFSVLHMFYETIKWMDKQIAALKWISFECIRIWLLLLYGWCMQRVGHACLHKWMSSNRLKTTNKIIILCLHEDLWVFHDFVWSVCVFEQFFEEINRRSRMHMSKWAATNSSQRASNNNSTYRNNNNHASYSQCVCVCVSLYMLSYHLSACNWMMTQKKRQREDTFEFVCQINQSDSSFSIDLWCLLRGNAWNHANIRGVFFFAHNLSWNFSKLEQSALHSTHTHSERTHTQSTVR